MLRVIGKASKLVRSAFPTSSLIFKAITLAEPTKKSLIPYLDAERQELPLPAPPPRVATVLYYLDKPTQFRELKVNLSDYAIFGQKNLDGKHAFVDATEMKKYEKACLNDTGVQDAIKQLQLPQEAIAVCDAWTYSPDGENDMSRRVVMVRTRTYPSSKVN